MDKLDFLKKKLEHANIDCMMVSSKENIYYLTGIDVDGILIVSSFESFFLTYAKYVDYAKSKASIGSMLTIIAIEKIADFKEFFSSFEICGIEEDAITYKEYISYQELFDVKFVPTYNIIEKIRAIKDDVEIECIKNTASYVSAIMGYVISTIQNVVAKKDTSFTEQDAFKLIEKLAVDFGLEIDKKDTYVCFGKNTKFPLIKQDNRLNFQADIVVISICAKDSRTNYYAKCARTILIGDVNLIPNLKDQYEKMCKIYDYVLRHANSNMEISFFAKEVKKMLSEINFMLNIQLGSSIGIAKQEVPYIDFNAKERFKENMVFAINITTTNNDDNYSIQFEDTIKITKSNNVNLTSGN